MKYIIRRAAIGAEVEGFLHVPPASASGSDNQWAIDLGNPGPEESEVVSKERSIALDRLEEDFSEVSEIHSYILAMRKSSDDRLTAELVT